MTTIKISQLPDATVPLNGTEIAPIDQNGVTKKVPVFEFSSMVTPRGFGAVGDGVADDTAAIQACLAAQKPVNWQGLTYKITAPILQACTSDVVWMGNGATIVYAPAAHTEYAIRLTNSVVIDYNINDLTINGFEFEHELRARF